MVTSDSKRDEASTQATTNSPDEKKEEPDTTATDGEGGGGDMEGESESKDEKAPPPPSDSLSDKMDTSPAPTAGSTSTSSSSNVTVGLSPGLGGLGRHRGLTEQLSRTPSSFSRVSNNMAAVSASKVTGGSTGLSSSLTPSEQLKQHQLLQVSKDTHVLSLSLSLSLSLCLRFTVLA